MTLAILLLGLVVATCVIAYLADNLGKNLGKKRISLFGLRPRQTATLISMASSVGVMLLTIVLLMATSKSISNALLNYDQKVSEANRQRELAEQQRARAQELSTELQNQIESKRRTIIQSERDLERVQKVLGGTRSQLLATRARLVEVERQRGTAERARISAQRSAETARRSAQSAQARYAQARRAFEALRSQLQAARTQYVTARNQLTREQTRVRQAQTRIAVVQRSLHASRAQIEVAQIQLNEAQRRRNEAQKSFQTAESQLKATLTQYETAATQLVELETRSKQLQEQVRSAQAEYEKARQAALQYLDIGAQIATGNISVSRGTVFSDTTIQPRTARNQIRENLQRLVQEGSSKLSGNKSTLVLSALPVSSGGTTVWLQGDELLDRLTEYLDMLDVPVSVRLTAARDHASNETEISVQYITVPVRTVYTEGEILAEKTINASASDARIFNQLLALLNEGEAAARAKKVLPLLGPENMYFFAPGTNERVFEALRRIQALKAPARVQLVAAQDINTAEPVRVRFEVERE